MLKGPRPGRDLKRKTGDDLACLVLESISRVVVCGERVAKGVRRDRKVSDAGGR